MANKRVEIEVGTESDLNGVTPLENKIKELQQRKLQFQIDTNTSKLEQVRARIQELEHKKATLDVDADDAEIQKIEAEIEKLKFEEIDLDLKVRQDELQQVESKIDSMDPTEIEVDVNNQTALQAVDQIGQGFDRLKQGASEVGEAMGTMLEAAGKQETNKVFLEQAIGAEKAATAMGTINEAVAKLPGDDTVIQGLLSQAVAKDASLTATELNNMGSAAADYFSAMSYYGKSSSEAFQDMNNYLLTGNTAEIERSPILANHIDKLKEATTIQERSKLLQEALNEEHWGGMSQQDTFNNKLETFNGMLERGKYNLGGMFQEGAKWGMDFIMKLDEASGGLVGMGIALGSFATPLVDTVTGLGQIATGINAIKDLGFIQFFKELEIVTKLSAAADWLLAGAQAVLNAVMALNPIVLVVLALVALAAALIWAYYNVDWFREMVDNAWAALVQFGQYIYGVVTGAIQWLGNLFNQFTSQLGLNTQDWIQAILGFILFIPQLPLRLGAALLDALARTLGFKGSFVSYIKTAASTALSNFISNISQIPSRLGAELSSALDKVNEWAATLPAKFWEAGVNAVKQFLSALGIASPGTMQRMLVWEVSEMGRRVPIEGEKLTGNLEKLGSDAVDSFGNPSLGIDFDDDASFANGSIEKVLNIAGQNRGDIIINIEGDVDSDRRVNQIVEVIRRELNWDNRTAGRII